VDIMYSPDSFSPPPMEDMSPTTGFPPPLDFPPDCSSPESGAADEEELEEDGDYDLTGLSDKLHTLELRKISNLPPREILELQKASEEMNSRFANSLQGLRMPGGEGLEEKRNSVTPPVQQFVSEKESALTSQEDLPVVDLNQNIPESISDEEEEHEQAFTPQKEEEVIQENIPFNSCDQDMPQCDELETIYNDLNGDCDYLEEHPAPKKESLKVETEAVIESRLDVELVSGSCDQTEGSGIVEGGWNAFPPNQDEDWGEPVKVGDWGDFNELKRTVEAEGFKGEDVDDDDDEFGDFGEAEEATPMESRDVTGLLERLEELRDWSELGDILGEVERQGGTDCEKRLGQVLGSQVEEDEVVWRLLEDPASSPGLDYVWRDSGTYNIVLSTLGIDSRVVLDGPGWLGQVRQAATLLTPGLLTPVPAAARQEKEGGQLEAQDPLAPSGEAAGRKKSGMEEARGEKIVRKSSNPGKEAAEILRAFPLLDFMASSLLVRNKK